MPPPPRQMLSLSLADSRTIPAIYAGLATLLLALFCLVTPPFFGADEIAHSERALQIAHGQWIAQRAHDGETVAELPDTPLPDAAPLPTRLVTPDNPAYGAPVDTNFLQAAMRSTFAQRRFVNRYPRWTARPDGRMSQAELATLQNLGWSGKQIYVNFQNTAVYPPPLYLPSALAWGWGERTGVSIVRTLYLVRAVNAAVAVALGWLALRLAAGQRLLFAAVLLLPALLNVEASCSQDAMLVPLAVLVGSVLTRALHAERFWRTGELMFLTAALALLIAARPPYLWLLMILFLPALEQAASARRWMVSSAAAVAALVLVTAWRYLIRFAPLSHAAVADPPAQIAFLKAHSLRAVVILLKGTLRNAPGLLVRGVEVLEMKRLATMVLLFGLHIGAFLVIPLLTRGTVLRARSSRLALSVALLAVVATISLAEYVIWNQPGSTRLDGLQARYFLALLPLASLLALRPARHPRGEGSTLTPRAGLALQVALPVFLAGVLYTPFLLAHRYYDAGLGSALQWALH